ncbi:hypothetical protein Rhow_007411 [Rhodococcus wratislaviensis]|uniref:Uncharacterized protein n=1 Tax=Rhodococcus wratislaviensis TaxID=44752 RepID=A0A402CI60_RHOWR|nr:hypothetical protein Rhow_007411 [Rhodococcus wratislaviensis]
MPAPGVGKPSFPTELPQAHAIARESDESVCIFARTGANR